MAIDYLSLTPGPRLNSAVPATRTGGAANALAVPGAGNSTEMMGSFKDMLGELVGNTDQLQRQSQEMTQQLATGQITNVHDVMIAAEKAKMAMQLTLAIRGKLLEAYQALQQMR